MVGVELDMVVSDSLQAIELYQKIFEIEVIEATKFDRGQNEVVFNLYGTRFHMLDENPAFQLVAPKQGEGKPTWFNILTGDVKGVFEKAIHYGCSEIQPVTTMEDYGVTNAMFLDPFGYIWMLTQLDRQVSFEDREKMFAEALKKEE